MKRIGIIGTGIAGMGCGHLLHKQFDITCFEKNDYIGGHTNTLTVPDNGSDIYIDTGFMVFNSETYPHLFNLFKEIGAPIQKTDMSFSVQHRPSGLEYSGAGLKGLFAQGKNLFKLSYLRMLTEISRFNRISVDILDKPQYMRYTLNDYIREFKFSQDVLNKYLIPMSSAVWSTPADKMLDFPAATLIRFFKNHGFLGLHTQHQWYTIRNGSRSYRDLLIKPFEDKIKARKTAVKVTRLGDGARILFRDGSTAEFDKVILACHADQALSMLEDPTPNEKRLLSPFKYQKNTAAVHTDTSVMPRHKKTWSSWNYRIEKVNGDLVPTTIYWMNNLQQVSQNKDYFVSINPLPGTIDPKTVIKQMVYEHPLFDVETIRAQEELRLLNEGGPLYYCGSYFRYGFHEDAYKSAVDLAEILKQPL